FALRIMPPRIVLPRRPRRACEQRAARCYRRRTLHEPAARQTPLLRIFTCHWRSFYSLCRVRRPKLSVHAMSVLPVMVVIVVVVIPIVVMMIVILREILAQPLGGAVVGVARQHIARGSLRDQAIRVLLEQEAFADLLSGGVPHYAVVPLLAAVALLDRAARIPARHARGLGHGERNIAGGQIAFVALQRPARDRVP